MAEWADRRLTAILEAGLGKGVVVGTDHHWQMRLLVEGTSAIWGFAYSLVKPFLSLVVHFNPLYPLK